MVRTATAIVKTGLLTTFLFVAGCVTTRPLVSGEELVPVSLAPAAQSNVQLTSHQEASATAAGPMTLDQAIYACLAADPKLRSGLEAVHVANAVALTASLRPNPDMFIDVQLVPLVRPFTAQRPGGP